MDEMIESLKTVWPEFHITKDDILHPTSESVCRFYSTFLSDFEEKMAYAIDFYRDDLKPDLDSDEERLFLKMQKLNSIFTKAGVTFYLGDIISPTFTRTRSFICMCVHIMIFFGNIVQSFEKTCGDVLKMREDFSKLFDEKDNFLIKINEYIIQRLQLLQENEELEQEIQKLEAANEDYCNERIKKEREINAPRRKDLKRLEMTAEEKAISIEKLTIKEKKYLEEAITEDEYLELKKLEKDLELEKESLRTDDVDMDNFLSYEYKIVDHFKHCGKAIPDQLNVDFINRHIKMEEQLEDLHMRIEKLSSEISSNKFTLNHQKKLNKEAEALCVKADRETELILQNIHAKFEALTQKVQQEKEQICAVNRDALAYNMEIKTEIEQLEEEFEDLRDHFRKEYIKITKTEDLAIMEIKEAIENFYN